MTEKQSNRTLFTIKALKTKAIEFIIMYGIISVYSFSGANSVAHSIFDNLSTLFTSDLFIDGADFSIFANLFAAPIYIALVAINIIITLVIDIVLILIFKKLYFKSGVIKEEKEELYRYIKIILASFILIGFIIAVTFLGSMKWITVFMLGYLPVPIIVFTIVRAKFKKIYSDEQ